ncbi:MAG TPA: sigma-70 family RNA polymerase sigma factor [Archangium sp.]|uniref:RNA polymerase sigma factor n=1 Tax=Archangium sp. TaxID=1872627 RepID=UPI002EDB1AFF
MPSSPAVPVCAPRGFVTTRWSLVLAAGRKGGTKEGHRALSELCEIYWYPVYTFVRRRGHPEDEARDLTQGFFTRLLEKNDLEDAKPSKGRFRAWLRQSVKNYLTNEWDRERALKRGGAQVRFSLQEAEDALNWEAASGLTPERAFDRSWVERLLRHVLATLGEEYERDGNGPRFEQLKKSLTGEEGDSYEHIASELGMTEAAVRTAAYRLRKRFRTLLLEEISHTVEHPEDVADELRFLISVFEDV